MRIIDASHKRSNPALTALNSVKHLHRDPPRGYKESSNYSPRIAVSFDSETFDTLKKISSMKGITFGSVVRQFVLEGLQRLNNGN